MTLPQWLWTGTFVFIAGVFIVTGVKKVLDERTIKDEEEQRRITQEVKDIVDR